MAKDVKFRHAAKKDCADAQAGLSLHSAEADLSYARACSEYQDFVGGGRLLTTRLLTLFPYVQADRYCGRSVLSK